MRRGIQAYNKATDTPESIDRGYHETITQAFMRLVYAAHRRTGPYPSSEKFCDAHPELLSKYVLQTFYSRERLMTAEAKAGFIEPDLRPLPSVNSDNQSLGDQARQSPTEDAPKLDDRFELIDTFDEQQIEQLHALIEQQWWGGNRSLDDVKVMAKHTSLMFGLVDRESGRLVGCCRVLTDFAFRAMIYDVIVAEELQGKGLGRRLMAAICDHPCLQQVSYLYLCCEPQLFPFYERFGFTRYESMRTDWMIKVQREE